jgi:hypothetical protein
MNKQIISALLASTATKTTAAANPSWHGVEAAHDTGIGSHNARNENAVQRMPAVLTHLATQMDTEKRRRGAEGGSTGMLPGTAPAKSHRCRPLFLCKDPRQLANGRLPPRAGRRMWTMSLPFSSRPSRGGHNVKRASRRSPNMGGDGVMRSTTKGLA